MLQPTAHHVSRSSPFALPVMAALLAGGCEPAAPPTIASISVTPATVTMEDIEEFVQLEATVADENGKTITGLTINWLSSDVDIATVTPGGRLRGKQPGTASIWAFVESVADTVPVTIELGPRAVMVRIYNSLGGSGWGNDTNWGSDRPFDSWYGIQADAAGNITQLSLSDNGLSGSIPPEIGRLVHLEQLNLSDNAVTGLLPVEIGDLRNLEGLNLANTQLEGPLPAEMGNLRSLEVLDFSLPELHPSRIGGPIPPEMGNLANLRTLVMSGTGLSGPIPPELGNLANVRVFNLGANALSGSIPAEIGNLGNARDIQLAGNRLTGPIPPELGNLRSVSTLGLDRNRLSGPVPPELGALGTLRQFLLAYNDDLSGRLPIELTDLSLSTFFWNSTDLCAPGEQEFQEWLQSINNHMGGEDCDES